MVAKSQRPKGLDGALSSLNLAIDALNLAKEISSATPAKVVFGSVSVLLAMIRVCFLVFCGSEVPDSGVSRILCPTSWTMSNSG